MKRSRKCNEGSEKKKEVKATSMYKYGRKVGDT